MVGDAVICYLGNQLGSELYNFFVFFLEKMGKIWKIWKLTSMFGIKGKMKIDLCATEAAESKGDHGFINSEDLMEKLKIEDEPPAVFDVLPNEMIHCILDRLPSETNFKSLRLISKRWEFVVSSRFIFIPYLSDSTLNMFSDFFENAAGKKVTAVRVGDISDDKEFAWHEFNFPEEAETVVFESVYNSSGMNTVSRIIKAFQNLKDVTFKQFEPETPDKIGFEKLCKETDLRSLKSLTLMKPRSGSFNLVPFDLNFTSTLPGLESLQLRQIYSTRIFNLTALPVSLKVFELCVKFVDLPLVTSILTHLPNLEVLRLEGLIIEIPIQTPVLQISLNTVKDLLQHPKLKKFSCLPAELTLKVNDLRQQTSELEFDGKRVKFWYGHTRYQYHFIVCMVRN